MSFGRSRRALPGTTKKPYDSSKDTSFMAVGKLFFVLNILYGCNEFSIKFNEGYPMKGGWRVRVPPSGYVHQKCIPVGFVYKKVR